LQTATTRPLHGERDGIRLQHRRNARQHIRESHMAYVDGFVIPVPKKNLKAYQKLSKAAGKVWMKYGALEYRECVGEDLNPKMPMTFPKLTKLKRGETVVFSWIVYKSRKHRDSVNAKVMKDKVMTSMNPADCPFDFKRMSCGGFKIFVDM
jgi:uncharacterized protein YbaA (DUF1428 family)